MNMNKHEKDMKDRLEAMPLEQARTEITTGAFATIGSPNHEFDLSWLSDKEAELRDARDTEALAIARSADLSAKEALRVAKQEKIIAIIAPIIATIAAIVAIVKH